MSIAVKPGSKSRRRVAISPLRYPGGKGSLYEPLQRLIRANDLQNATYVEPYAGGAGAALALLVTGQVRKIAINDLDPAIYAFWRLLLDQPEELSKLILETDLTVTEWQIQRDAYLNSSPEDYLALGFATFYLNRTNRSGLLNGGPIGGKNQTGNYKIDARFNRVGLVERVRSISLYRKSITVTNVDGIDVIKKYHKRANTLIYADPPYFEKAGSLYMNSFKFDDHVSLSECLNGYSNSKWILTYDNVPQVEELYPARRREVFALNYSAHKASKAKEIMVYSDAMCVDY